MLEESNNRDIVKAIIKTVAFFDLFDYPLTGWEVYKFLLRMTRISEGRRIADGADDFLAVKETLSQLVDSRRLEEKFGFYFLAGREAGVEVRRNRYNIAEGKFSIVLKTVKWWRWLTNLKMVAVCNNLAYSNADENSDLDVFIIAAAGKLWLTRLLITIIVQLLGRRRHGQKVANRICLSFYITDDSLNLQDITLRPDPYFYFWLATLSPVYDDGIYEKFWQVNGWVKDFLPNIFIRRLNFRRRVEANKIMKLDKKLNQKFDKILLGGRVGKCLEKIAKKIQLKKMAANFSSVANQNDTRVIISDTMLKFHEQDRRAEYCERWVNKLKQLQS